MQYTVHGMHYVRALCIQTRAVGALSVSTVYISADTLGEHCVRPACSGHAVGKSMKKFNLSINKINKYPSIKIAI